MDSIGKNVRNHAHIDGFESLLAFTKNGYDATHKKISRKHLSRYIIGVVRRQNRHGTGLNIKMKEIACNFIKKRSPNNNAVTNNGLVMDAP